MRVRLNYSRTYLRISLLLISFLVRLLRRWLCLEPNLWNYGSRLSSCRSRALETISDLKEHFRVLISRAERPSQRAVFAEVTSLVVLLKSFVTFLDMSSGV